MTIACVCLFMLCKATQNYVVLNESVHVSYGEYVLRHLIQLAKYIASWLYVKCICIIINCVIEILTRNYTYRNTFIAIQEIIICDWALENQSYLHVKFDLILRVKM